MVKIGSKVAARVTAGLKKLQALLLGIVTACGPKAPADAEPKSVVVVPDAGLGEQRPAHDAAAPLPSVERAGWASRLAKCQPEPSQDELESAKRLFQDGVRAYEEGDYERVALIFAASYIRSCAAPVLFNLGMTLERAGDRAGALEVYELYVERSPDASHAEEVRRRMDALRASAGARP